MLLRPLPPLDGHRRALRLRARPAPRPQGAQTAARRRPTVLGAEPEGTGGPAARVGTGLQRPEGASDSALLEPSDGGQAGGQPRTVAGGVASIPRTPA